MTTQNQTLAVPLTEEQLLNQRIFSLRETVKEQGIENAQLLRSLQLANDEIVRLTAIVATLTDTLDKLAENFE